MGLLSSQHYLILFYSRGQFSVLTLELLQVWTLLLELTFLFVVPVVSWPPRCGGHCGKMEEGAQSSPDQDTTQTRRGVEAPKTAPNTSKRFVAVPHGLSMRYSGATK